MTKSNLESTDQSSEASCIARTDELPATVNRLTADLARLGVSEGMTLMVHSGLSSLGWVCGGPVTVIEALLGALGTEGTLVMPTHSTVLSDPAHWVNPPVPESWWPVIREHTPAFDPRRTPSRMMGAIAECFRAWPEVMRSDHPHHSFAAHGPKARVITDDHRLAYGLGEHSPLARLYDLGAHVLLLGVDHDRNTSLHLAEYRALHEHVPTFTTGAPVLRDGKREWVAFAEPDFPDLDFKAMGAAFAKETGGVRQARVAQADARLMSQSALVDFAAQWIKSDRPE